MSDRSFRRAGLDYLDHVEITRHMDWSAFQVWRQAWRTSDLARDQETSRLVLLTTHAPTRYVDFAYAPRDILLLGRESAGVPEFVHAAADARVRIPLRPGLRSLNIAVAAALVLGEALRQTDGFP